MPRLPIDVAGALSWLVVAGISLLVGCNPDCSPETRMLHGGTVQFSPEKDSVRAGDTIWVDMTIPKNCTVDTGETVDVTGATNVASLLNIHAIPNYNSLANAADSFQFIPVSGTVTRQKSGDASAEVAFQSGSSGYNCRFGMVAEKKGVYVLTMVDLFEIRKQCLKAPVEVLVVNEDPHLYILDQIYNSTSPFEPEVPAYDINHDYCFKVY